MSEQPPIEELIPISRLRQMFNDAGMEERALHGDLYATPEADGHPSPPLAGEPFCTRSQILAYRDDTGRELARVHRYLRPDGRVGLDGRCDPQEMLGPDGVWYIGGRYPDAEG
jgi:hypothetical protein